MASLATFKRCGVSRMRHSGPTSRAGAGQHDRLPARAIAHQQRPMARHGADIPRPTPRAERGGVMRAGRVSSSVATLAGEAAARGDGEGA